MANKITNEYINELLGWSLIDGIWHTSVGEPAEPDDWLHDLDACTRLEDEIWARELKDQYIEGLIGRKWKMGDPVMPFQLWILVRATADDRCRAFVHAMELGG